VWDVLVSGCVLASNISDDRSCVQVEVYKACCDHALLLLHHVNVVNGGWNAELEHPDIYFFGGSKEFE
jgi:hypothetical protein